MAASLGVLNTEKNPLECLNVNILGTKAVLDVVRKNKIKKIIFSSSSEVYGDQEKFPIKENYEFKIKSNYALSKITSEFFVKSYAKKFGFSYNIVDFLMFMVSIKKKFCYFKFINQVLIKRFKCIWKWSQIRSFCNVEDAARGLLLVLNKGKKTKFII